MEDREYPKWEGVAAESVVVAHREVQASTRATKERSAVKPKVLRPDNAGPFGHPR